MPGKLIQPPRKAVIVGAGPVGCLCAISLAKQGWLVDIYEGRPDMRLASSRAAAQLRSINLTISARGLTALRVIDPALSERFMDSAIPMRGRMIHSLNGSQQKQDYDTQGNCINSINRALLNENLLRDALAVPNIQVFFNHKAVSVDFDARVLEVRDTERKSTMQVNFDFCVGADGTYSVVRRQMMRVMQMDYEQGYIPHEYVELRMLPGPPSHPGGEPTFLLDPNYLHVWPRHTFMLIAMPNKDKTFTVTLFAHKGELDSLNSREARLKFFRTNFPDATKLIGEDLLLSDLERNPRSSLMTLKTSPYHYKDRAIIIGDAGHAMVPFYGQGLNCGLEDVRVLDLLLKRHQVDPMHFPSQGQEDTRLARALEQYTETRHEDLVTIPDLAMNNYIEMRHSVTTPAYLFRKAVDNVLHALTAEKHVPDTRISDKLEDPFPTRVPSGWIPLYTMVTFRPDINYATVKRKAKRQNQIISYAGWTLTALTVSTVSVTCFKMWQKFQNST